MKTYKLAYGVSHGISAYGEPSQNIEASSDEEAIGQAQKCWDEKALAGKAVGDTCQFISFAEVRDLGWKPR